jgi:hypothetical protein
LWDGRTSSFDGGIWTRSRTWLVRTSVKTDREDVVSTATGLPAYADPHPADDSSYATTISYTQLAETPLAWNVTVGYSSERELATGPQNDEVLISWTSEIYQESIFRDYDGDAILNSAGDYFIDPSPTREATHLIAKIKANVLSVPSWVIDYQNAVNLNSVTIGGLVIGEKLAKVQRIEIGERQERNGVQFYELSYEVHIHRDGWRLKPLDAGFRELVGGVAVQIVIDGEEPTTPVPLSGGSLLNPATPSTAVFLDFQIYPELDLTVLPGIT